MNFISDTGYITGAGISNGGAKHTFLLTEVPGSAISELETLSLLVFDLVELTVSH